MDGVLNIYKEQGYTSHDVVAKLRGILKQKKIGHTGTLDPMAEGVLPVCVGNATRLCDMLTADEKEYEAVLLLGVSTDTQDVTGTVLRRADKKELEALTEESVRQVCEGFVGEYDQLPPMYSAIKIGGKKLYELAREGKEIERETRRIRIDRLTILSMKLPRVRFLVSCSKGTYIRTLCSDIGDRLLVGGTMESLVRIRSGSFGRDNARRLSEIEELVQKGSISEALLSVESFFSDYRKLSAGQVREDELQTYEKLLRNGNPLPDWIVRLSCRDGELVRTYHTDDRFAGIYRYDKRKRCYGAYKMFPASD